MNTNLFAKPLLVATLVILSASSSSRAADDDAATRERDELLSKAAASVTAAAEKVLDDPTRPIYHLLPPANWMNDPNGLVHHNGYYHVFYQHNPYGDAWGNMHWGHFRSKDLVHWEHLPIAIWPSKSRGEEHVFSGSATKTADGKLMLFYTSIGNRNPEQWAAVPEDDTDDKLIRWKKHPANPLLTEALHGDTKVYEWRDPYVFQVNGKTHLVCGGNLNKNAGGQAAVLVYRAENPELTRWKYLGVLYEERDPKVKNIECPLFFPLGGKWVLITSPHGPVQYYVGTLDETSMKFKPERRGIVDHGSFYAPNVMIDPKGRALMWGWIRDFPGGKGWNGCLTVPRELSLGKENELVQSPAPELILLAPATFLLAGKQHQLKDLSLGEKPYVLKQKADDPFQLSIILDINQANSVTINLGHRKDGEQTTIRFGGRQIEIAGRKAALELPKDRLLALNVLADRSVLEVFANGRVCESHVVPTGLSGEVTVSASGGEAQLTLGQWWPMRTIWKE
jgi:beta-fructofuranosidase